MGGDRRNGWLILRIVENLEPMFRTMWCFFMVSLLLGLSGIVPLEDMEYLMHRTVFWLRDMGRTMYATLPGQ